MEKQVEVLVTFVILSAVVLTTTNAASTPQFPADFMPYTLKQAQAWGEKVGLSRNEVTAIVNYRKKYNEASSVEEKVNAIQDACSYIAKGTSLDVSRLNEPANIQKLPNDIFGQTLRMEYWEKEMQNTEDHRLKVLYLKKVCYISTL